MRQFSVVILFAFGSVLPVQDTFSPARAHSVKAPALPVLAVGGGQVILELAVSRNGSVTGVTPLRTTDGFPSALVSIVRDWQFSPATELVRHRTARGDEDVKVPVDSKVLVVGVFRRPAVYAPTQGEQPRDTTAPSMEVAFPLTMTEPLYPPLAHSGGVVLVEARIDRDGRITETEVVGSAPPFDDAARAALRNWTFRGARVKGVPTATYVYLVFGFPTPIAH